MTYEQMKEEVTYIITKHLKYHICFLIGDNMTGKTDIANLVKKIDPSIIIFDNYRGRYDELPSKGKILVITHNPIILKCANPTDKIIMLQSNYIYLVTDIEDKSHVDSIFYKMSSNNYNSNFLLSCLLNNACQGCWSKLNNEFLEIYKKEKGTITKSDELIFKEIENWKNSEGLLYN